MFKKTLIAAAFATAAASFGSSHVAQASDGSCGYFAFAGAFQNYRSAQRKARRIGAVAMDLDQSDSPNAGKGYWVVAVGPGSRSWAKREQRRLRRNGAGSTYVASRCIWG
jgi:hypothetical protein